MEENTYLKNKRKLGTVGEDFAAGILETQGYRIVEKNFRCRLGEIDLIAEKENELCFIEVKMRNSDDFGRPAEAVNLKKQGTIKRVAAVYLYLANISDRDISFGVFEICFNQIEHAFY